MDFIQVEIDKNKCLGCEICTVICPEIFKANEKNDSVEAFSGTVSGVLVDKCIEASESCPAEAVRITPPNLWKDESRNSEYI